MGGVGKKKATPLFWGWKRLPRAKSPTHKRKRFFFKNKGNKLKPRRAENCPPPNRSQPQQGPNPGLVPNRGTQAGVWGGKDLPGKKSWSPPTPNPPSGQFFCCLFFFWHNKKKTSKNSCVFMEGWGGGGGTKGKVWFENPKSFGSSEQKVGFSKKIHPEEPNVRKNHLKVPRGFQKKGVKSVLCFFFLWCVVTGFAEVLVCPPHKPGWTTSSGETKDKEIEETPSNNPQPNQQTPRSPQPSSCWVVPNQLFFCFLCFGYPNRKEKGNTFGFKGNENQGMVYWYSERAKKTPKKDPKRWSPCVWGEKKSHFGHQVFWVPTKVLKIYKKTRQPWQ